MSSDEGLTTARTTASKSLRSTTDLTTAKEEEKKNHPKLMRAKKKKTPKQHRETKIPTTTSPDAGIFSGPTPKTATAPTATDRNSKRPTINKTTIPVVADRKSDPSPKSPKAKTKSKAPAAAKLDPKIPPIADHHQTSLIVLKQPISMLKLPPLTSTYLSKGTGDDHHLKATIPKKALHITDTDFADLVDETKPVDKIEYELFEKRPKKDKSKMSSVEKSKKVTINDGYERMPLKTAKSKDGYERMMPQPDDAIPTKKSKSQRKRGKKSKSKPKPDLDEQSNSENIQSVAEVRPTGRMARMEQARKKRVKNAYQRMIIVTILILSSSFVVGFFIGIGAYVGTRA